MKRPIRPPGRLTQAAYARHRGCDPRDVRRALKDGKIKANRDGYIDPAKADAAWAANTNPASASKPGAKPGMKPVSADAIKAARDVLRNAGQTVGGGAMTFTEARTANEIVKAQIGALRLAERRGELISKAWATDTTFKFIRLTRDGLLAWPSRISAMLAAELGCDPHALERAIDREVKAYLRSVAEMDLEGALSSPSSRKPAP